MTKRNIFATVALILTVLLSVFIFGSSMKSVAASTEMSESVRDILKPLLGLIVGPENVTDHLVRKLAHFTEFAALGVLTALLAVAFGKIRFRHAVNCEFLLLLAALTDETIQIFSGRGPLVSDIWLDFVASTLGFLFTMLIAKLSRAGGGKKK